MRLPHPAGPPKMLDRSKDQLGTVIVFKPGTTKAQAEQALAKIKDVVDLDAAYPKGLPAVQSFNPDHGSPVWYIP